MMRWCADNRGAHGVDTMRCPGAGRYFVRVWRGFVYKEVSNETKVFTEVAEFITK